MAVRILLLCCSLLPLAAVQGSGNECLLPRIAADSRNGPHDFDCAAWVVRTTDEIWNSGREAVNASIDKYFTTDFLAFENGRVTGTSREQVKEGVARRFASYPDVRIKITDCFCEGNDLDGYKTTMPDMVMGTNLGATEYGPATGRKVAYTGIANTWVKKVEGEWRYVAEWVMHDKMTEMMQLGFSSPPATLTASAVKQQPTMCSTWPLWDPAGKGEGLDTVLLQAAVQQPAAAASNGHSTAAMVVAGLCGAMLAALITSLLLLRRPRGQQQLQADHSQELLGAQAQA